VAQEGFLRAWEQRADFNRARGTRATWISNICLTIARARCSKKQLELRGREESNRSEELAQFEVAPSVGDEEESASGEIHDAAGPERNLDRVHLLVRQALPTLSEREQAILTADANSREGRLPDAYHAEELNMSLAAAQRAHLRAYERLKAALELLGLTLESLEAKDS
jgi:DNA-directed RNA polymerase specialized sigma24 family protein